MKKFVGIAILSILLLTGCSEMDLQELTTAFDNSSNNESLLNEYLLDMLKNAEVKIEGEDRLYNEIYTMTNTYDVTFDLIVMEYEIFNKDGIKLGSNYNIMKNVVPGQAFEFRLNGMLKKGTAYFVITDIKSTY